MKIGVEIKEFSVARVWFHYYDTYTVFLMSETIFDPNPNPNLDPALTMSPKNRRLFSTGSITLRVIYLQRGMFFCRVKRVNWSSCGEGTG